VKRTRDDERRPGPLEGIFQEVVRRAAAAGFSSFFMTEEAIRQALSENLPRDWVDYAARQGGAVRGELVDRLAAEFGAWLRALDTEALLRTVVQLVLEHYDLRLEIDLSARPSSEHAPAKLTAVLRRKGAAG
jgi:hypothetical protein